MKISTRGRYAIRMLQDIAQQRSGGNCTLKSIAERQEISPKYLEQIAKVLVSQGILEASHGKGGGYRIHGSPADYTIYSVLTALEGPMCPVACMETPENTCPRCETCVTLPIWTGLDQVIREYLSQYTIADLIK